MRFSTLLVVFGTLFVVAGILSLSASEYYSNQEEDARNHVRKQNQKIERLWQNFLKGEQHRSNRTVLFALMTVIRESREQNSRPKYDDEEFKDVLRETRRESWSAIDAMSAASGKNSGKNNLDFYILMNELTNKFVDHNNRQVKERKKMEKRVSEHRSKARRWQHFAHLLNIVGVMLIMLKDVAKFRTST